MNAMSPMQRYVLFASVVCLHALVLWAVQMSLQMRARVNEVIAPIKAITAFLIPPEPVIPKPVSLSKPVPRSQREKESPQTIPSTAPALLSAKDSPSAMTTSETPVVSNSAPSHVPFSVPSPASTNALAFPANPPSPAHTPAPKLELPRSDADYLNNPAPAYPAVSRRMGEQGRVLLRVWVSEDGTAQKIELRSSSGSERLDAAAIATVQRWRFKPGLRGGVPEAMWVNIPIDFKLD